MRVGNICCVRHRRARVGGRWVDRRGSLCAHLTPQRVEALSTSLMCLLLRLPRRPVPDV